MLTEISSGDSAMAEIEYNGNFSDGDYCFIQLNAPGSIHYLYAASSPLFFRSG